MLLLRSAISRRSLGSRWSNILSPVSETRITYVLDLLKFVDALNKLLKDIETNTYIVLLACVAQSTAIPFKLEKDQQEQKEERYIE